jgi:hypothetical protein
MDFQQPRICEEGQMMVTRKFQRLVIQYEGDEAMTFDARSSIAAQRLWLVAITLLGAWMIYGYLADGSALQLFCVLFMVVVYYVYQMSHNRNYSGRFDKHLGKFFWIKHRLLGTKIAEARETIEIATIEKFTIAQNSRRYALDTFQLLLTFRRDSAQVPLTPPSFNLLDTQRLAQELQVFLALEKSITVTQGSL